MHSVPEPSSGATSDQRSRDTLDRSVCGSPEPCAGVEPPRTPLEIIQAIRETHGQRNDFIRAEGTLTRQIKAICRRAVDFSTFDPAPIRKKKMALATALYESVEHGQGSETSWVAYQSTVQLRELRDGASKGRKLIEKKLIELAKTTHVAPFVEATPGFGYIGLAQIIGEAGDLWSYHGVAKLWKRMGLGLISSGERQRRFTDKAKALEAGYSPRRRSVMFVIGDSLCKAKGPYHDLKVQRKAFEVEKAVAKGFKVLPSAKIKAAEKAQCMSLGHVDIRGQRYAEKRLLRDLWRAWRGQTGEGPQTWLKAA